MALARVHRSERVLLPADGRRCSVLNLDGQSRSEWRIVETYSESLSPFELELQWSNGTGINPTTQVTVPGSTRLCILARSVSISARNLSISANPVSAHIADGCIGTSNIWVYLGSCDGSTPVQLPIPPYAQSVRVELEVPGLRSTTTLEARYGADTLYALCSLLEQPSAGVMLGGCTRLVLNATATTRFRALYSLSL